MSRITDALDAEHALPTAPSAQPMVVTSHPVARAAALATLEAGGSAVDAAVTAVAVLGVVDPMSTSLGGDCFAMVWDGMTLHGIDGSGRAPAAASLDALRELGHAEIPERGALPITVPGALDAWRALLERFGRRSLGDALRPAIECARDGYELTPVVARDWAAASDVLRDGVGTDALLPAPKVGQRFTWPALADTLQAIAEHGTDHLYRGPLGERIAARVQALGGWLTTDDLAAHQSVWVEPLEGVYRGHPVHQLPPAGQGVVVLEALAMLDEFPLGDLDPVDRAHLQIEALKLAFADAGAHLGQDTDPRVFTDPARIEQRLQVLDEHRERANPAPRALPLQGDTVYVAVVDSDGMACSLINSVYMHFGSGVVVDGVVLQNRGHLFSADPTHPNVLAGGRRPYHTIIPSMVFRSGRPWLVFGVVGGFQQPQAQVQLLVRLIDEGMSLQDAVDAPRFRWIDEDHVGLEAGTSPELVAALAARGHRLTEASGHGGFGGAQAILIDGHQLVGATDPRKDGVVRTT